MSAAAIQSWIKPLGTSVGHPPDQDCATTFPVLTSRVRSAFRSDHRNEVRGVSVSSISNSARRIYTLNASTVFALSFMRFTVMAFAEPDQNLGATCSSVPDF